MKRSLLFVLFCCFYNLNAQDLTNFTKSIYFATAKSEITTESLISLEEITKNIATYEDYFITIQGNTDNIGSDEYNKKLSEKRCNAVKEYFLSKNIATTKIALTSYGEEKPIASNELEDGKQKNRRVDIILTNIKYKVKKQAPKPKEEPKPVVTLPPVKQEPKITNKITELYDLLADSPQEFQLQTKKDYVITGKEGTVLYFKANTIMTNCPTVTIKLKEVYKQSAMVLENLTTITDKDEVLSSAGMFSVEILDCNNNRVGLKGNNVLPFAIPTKEYDPDMRIYNGIHGIEHTKQTFLDRTSSIFWRQQTNNNLMQWNSVPENRVCDVDYRSGCYFPIPFRRVIKGIFIKSIKRHNKAQRICHKVDKIIHKRDLLFRKIYLLKQNGSSNTDKLVEECKEYTQQILELRQKEYHLYAFNNQHFMKDNEQLKTEVGSCFGVDYRLAMINLRDVDAFLQALNSDTVATNIKESEAANVFLNNRKAEKANAEYISRIERNENIDFKDIQHYLGSTAIIDNNNWINIDKLDEIPKEEQAIVITDLKKSNNNSCRIILRNSRTVIAADEKNAFYNFTTRKNAKAKIVALKYDNNQPYLALQDLKAKNNDKEEIIFQPMTVQEIKEKLKILDISER